MSPQVAHHQPRLTAMVTGASRGIGTATAELFFMRGWNVIMLSRSAKDLEQAARTFSDEGEPRICTEAADVSSEADVVRAFASARRNFGPVHVLVNNAAILVKKNLVELTVSDWETTLAVNLKGVFLCSKEFFKMHALETSQPVKVIVNVSSFSGIQHTQKFPGFSAYAASKSGVTALTEVLAVEGKEHGISVIGVAPGAVDTDMLKNAQIDIQPGARPQDIAEVIFQAASSASSRLYSGSTWTLDTNR